ncbi:MAG: hypothetical protein PHE84_13795 [bacterium]|nr:hypothetical protein [bacterium]
MKRIVNNRLHFFPSLIFLIALIIFPAVIEAGNIRWQNHSLLRSQSLLISQADTDELFENPKPQSQPEPKPLPSAESENKSVNKDFLKFDKPKSYLVTMGMDFLPLAALIGGSIYCSTLPGSTYGKWNSEELFCFRKLQFSSLALLGIGTLPSDIYVSSKPYKIVLIDLSKMLLNGIFLFNGYFWSDWNNGLEKTKYFIDLGFVPGVISASLIYLGEIISHGVKVYKINKYVNEKNQEKNTVIIPMVWKNQVGLALFRSF